MACRTSEIQVSLDENGLLDDIFVFDHVKSSASQVEQLLTCGIWWYEPAIGTSRKRTPPLATSSRRDSWRTLERSLYHFGNATVVP